MDFCTISGTNSLTAAFLKVNYSYIESTLVPFIDFYFCFRTARQSLAYVPLLAIPNADFSSGDINKIMRLQLNNILWLTLNQIECYIGIYTEKYKSSMFLSINNDYVISMF